MIIQVYSGRKWFRQKWFFRIKASNSRILAHSEAYTNKDDAIAAAELIKSKAPRARLDIEK